MDTIDCPHFRKATRTTTRDATLAKELEVEKKRNASLVEKLRKAKSDNKRLEKSMGEGSFVRLHSTMREDNIGNEHNSVLMSSMSNLSFASLNVPECKPVDGEEDIDRKSFEQWLHMLEASMQLAGVMDEVTKMNIFTIKAGAKLLDVLEGTVSQPSFPNVDTFPYANAIHRLNAFFGSRDYIFMQRQKLRSLTQSVGETDVKYVKRVIAVAKLCDYSEGKLVEPVAETIQLHALNRKVRETGRKILRKGGSIADLLDKVRTVEIDQLNEDLFAKNHRPTETPAVAAVSSSVARFHDSKNIGYGNAGNIGYGNARNSGYGNARNQSNGRQYQSRSNIGFGSTNNNTNTQRNASGNWGASRGGRAFGRREFVRNATFRVPCWRCASRQHKPSECYAIDQTCRNCHAKGHFERACYQQSSNTPTTGSVKRRYSNEDKESSSRVKKIAAIKGDERDPAEESVSVASQLE